MSEILDWSDTSGEIPWEERVEHMMEMFRASRERGYHAHETVIINRRMLELFPCWGLGEEDNG